MLCLLIHKEPVVQTELQGTGLLVIGIQKFPSSPIIKVKKKRIYGVTVSLDLLLKQGNEKRSAHASAFFRLSSAWGCCSL